MAALSGFEFFKDSEGASVFSVVLAATVLLFVGVELFWFTRKVFQRDPSKNQPPTEIVWSLVPAIVLMGLAFIARNPPPKDWPAVSAAVGEPSATKR